MDEIINFEVPADRDAYRALDSAALDSLLESAYAAVEKLRAKGTSAFTVADLEALRTLKDVVASAREERELRAQAAAEGEKLLGELTPEAPAAEAEKTDEPEAAPAEQAPAEEQPAEGEQTTDEPAGEPAEQDEKKKEDALVASGNDTKQGAPRVGDVAKNAPAPAVPEAPKGDGLEHFARLVQGPDADAGKEFESFLDVAKVAERKFASYAGVAGTGRHTIATIQRQFAKELVATEEDADKVLEYAASESRLPGGNLVAAAGWCAPSQTVYDLVELETSDGMFDLPEIQVSRGGIRFTPGPDFSSIFGGTGYFHYTEAEAMALTEAAGKPCMEIPCPPFQDVRLDVDGVCITGSLLQRRGYPEIVERFIRGALIAHLHKINAWVINEVADGSTAVTLTADNLNGDSGATGLLAAVELAVEDIRYRHRMARNATVEVALPHWVLPVLRADFSRRTGVEQTNVTDAMLTAHFALRGARVQFPYDWQDFFAAQQTGLPTAGLPGGATALTNFPKTVDFLAYPAGTWVRGSDSVIRLDTLYDSTKLKTNQYTALFSEEGILVAKRGHDSRKYTVPLDPNGATGYPAINVTAAPAAA